MYELSNFRVTTKTHTRNIYRLIKCKCNIVNLDFSGNCSCFFLMVRVPALITTTTPLPPPMMIKIIIKANKK